MNIYGVSRNDTDFLIECGEANPWMTASPSCDSVLSSLLAFDDWLYVHAAGAVTAMAIGPFQLSTSFRNNHMQLHRVMGYVYVICVVVGSFGAFGLIAHTVSGALAGAGFITLNLLWLFSIYQALNNALNKEIKLHREWMMRNYGLTFAAVPFRCFPAIVSLFGVEPQLAYGIGAWIAVVFMIVITELIIRDQRVNRDVDTSVANKGALLQHDGLQPLTGRGGSLP